MQRVVGIGIGRFKCGWRNGIQCSVSSSATPGEMRNRDCLFLGKLDPNGGVLEGPLAFAADDKETGILELSLLG
jgi:hypothetical protein